MSYISDVADLCRKLAGLLDHPEPGLATWHQACDAVSSDLLGLLVPTGKRTPTQHLGLRYEVQRALNTLLTCEDRAPVKLARERLQEALNGDLPPAVQDAVSARDVEWCVAIGQWLGMDSGCRAPIVPEAFSECMEYAIHRNVLKR